MIEAALHAQLRGNTTVQEVSAGRPNMIIIFPGSHIVQEDQAECIVSSFTDKRWLPRVSKAC